MFVELSTNEKIVGKLPPVTDEDEHRAQYRLLNSNFRNRKLTIDQFKESIQNGFPYCAQLYNGYRHTRNFRRAQHFGLDLDHVKQRIEDINDPIIRYANFLHTTSSDSPDNPRGRAVFILKNPIKDRKTYELFVRAFMRATGLDVDEVCKDGVRIFYGAVDCRIVDIGHVITMGELLSITKPYINEIKQEDALKIQKMKPVDVTSLNGVSNLTVQNVLSRAVNPIYTCEDTKKNDTLLKVSRLVGGYVPHYVSYEEAFNVLENAISTRDIRSINTARNTISTGLKYGMSLPQKVESSQFMNIFDWIG